MQFSRTRKLQRQRVIACTLRTPPHEPRKHGPYNGGNLNQVAGQGTGQCEGTKWPTAAIGGRRRSSQVPRRTVAATLAHRASARWANRPVTIRQISSLMAVPPSVAGAGLSNSVWNSCAGSMPNVAKIVAKRSATL